MLAYKAIMCLHNMLGIVTKFITVTFIVISVGVYIKAGSRNDTPETSGTANMLAKMLLKGSSSATKGQIAEEIESMGANVSSNVDREITSMSLTCFKGDVSRAVAILGDAVSGATLDAAELEIAKQEQASANDAFNKD